MTVLTGALTIKHYNDIIDSFVKNVANSSKSYYVYVGKPNPWADDNNPPAATASIASYEQTAYDDIVYGKKITSYDISYMIPRYDWVSGTVYDQYDQEDEYLYLKQFYVITNEKNVYKCIDNNYGAPSTTKPIITATSGTFQTSDGYVWKYMYTASIDAYTKFTTNEYIPLVQNANVVANAVSGTIDHIRVVNGGNGYTTYTNGFIDAFISPSILQLANNSARNNFSRNNDFYKGSSIYLKTGFGSGQVRKIGASDGNAKTVRVTEPFDVYSRLHLENIVGGENIIVGQTVTQKLHKIDYIHLANYFNEGDIIIQSDSLATGTVISANDISLVVEMQETQTQLLFRGFGATPGQPNPYASFELDYPIYNSASTGAVQTGTVSMETGDNNVYGVGTTFTNLAVGNYIRIGTYPTVNMRRITQIISDTQLVVDPLTNFNESLSRSPFYLMSTAMTPVSIGLAVNATGYVYDTNLKGLEITITDPSRLNGKFYIGENVDLVDVNNIYQGANGTITYSNNTTVIINNKTGIDFVTGQYLLGSQSLLKTTISSITSYPNITIRNPSGRFHSGSTIHVRPSDNLRAEVANASLIYAYYTPNESTEYLITPTVTITGDGEGAEAYPVIDPVTNSVSSIVMVNTGMGYTYANLAVTANTHYGQGAELAPVISPIHGHGFDAEQELGSRYAGISVSYDGTEGFVFPSKGSFRKIGLIEDPKFNEVTVHMDTFDRMHLLIQNETGTFNQGEIVTQTGNSTSKPAGIVTSSYTTPTGDYIEIQDISNSGNWLTNIVGDTIIGHKNFYTANVIAANVNYFAIVGANVEIVSEVKAGATGTIYEADDANINYDTMTQVIKLSNVSGSFDANDTIIDYSSNTYANVVSIYTGNGSTDATTTFGRRFNQTARVTLTYSYGQYIDFEYVQQDVTNANGRIIDQYQDIDLIIDNLSGGEFIIGDNITDVSSGGTAKVIFANTSYLKLSAANYFDVPDQVFYSGDTINNDSGVTATVSTIYPVLILSDINGPKPFQINPLTGGVVYYITGIGSDRDSITASGAKGYNDVANTITLPDLVRESGTVLYVNNIQPFNRSNTSNEKVNLIIKF